MHDAHFLAHSPFLRNMLRRHLMVLHSCGVVPFPRARLTPKIVFDDTLALLVTETNSLAITGRPMRCRGIVREIITQA